ncbi:VanZ family protein [Paenibacillus sp. MBLB4367]|uniref:VanZ family protein n=1 Tax=Paenibacillus sp. MBLB4367 TaxID=3384767 RepID=UPI003907E8AE
MSGLGLYSFTNFSGNIAIFIPFGIFIPMLSESKNVSLERVFVLSLLVSLLLEGLQAVLSIGTFDVDDLLLNTSGGMLGFGIFWLCSILDRGRVYAARQES